MKNTKTKTNYINMYSDDYNSIDLKQNEIDNVYQNNLKKDDSLDKYFNPIEESHESEDILKKLDHLNLSDENSFELPQKIFEPLAQKNTNKIDNKIIINKEQNESKQNEKLSKYDLITDIKEENKNDIYFNSLNDNNNNNDELLLNENINENINAKNVLTEYALREKLNRICISLQGYTLKPKCYENLNNFSSYLPKLSKELYQPIDSIFDVFIELLFRMKEEFNVKENLIQKLNNISGINEGYDKKLLKLKKKLKIKIKK